MADLRKIEPAIEMPDPAYDEIVYRYVDGSDIIFLEKYGIKKRTPKGFWIDYYGTDKFVLGNPQFGKRWAYEDKEIALNSYIVRKRRQIEHAQATINTAQEHLERALEVKNDTHSRPSKSD